MVNDHHQDRQYLTALLTCQGYAVIEAADAFAALTLLEEHDPQLIISGARVPPVGGFEFVRRVRAHARSSSIPIVFYTPTAHERETRAVAELCGVQDIITRASAPDLVVDRVHALITRARLRGGFAVPPPLAEPATSGASAQLIDMVQELAAAEQQMTAVAAACQELTRDGRTPETLLPPIVAAIARVTGADYVVAGWFSDDRASAGDRAAFGTNDAIVATLRATPIADAFRSLIHDRLTLRWSENAGPAVMPFAGDTASLAVRCGMAVPLATPGGVHGWIVALNQVRSAEFSDRDEQAAVIIGGQAGIAYENARLLGELQGRGAELQTTIAHTTFALEAARTGVWTWELPGGQWHGSESLRSLLDLPADGAIGTLPQFLNLVAPDERPRVERAFAQSVADLSGLNVEFTAQRADRSVRVLHALGRVSVDASGTAARMHGVLTDVTDRRLLEAQLRQAQRIETVGLLAGGIAHDFNNMLTAILGYARLAQEQVEQRISPLAEIQQIHRAAERASLLTRQLLAFSRQQVLEPVALDLNAVIDDLAGMLRRLIGDHIQVGLALDPAIPAIRGDRSQIEQVIMNLVVNARDAMPVGGRVSIATSVAAWHDARTVRGTPALPGTYAVLSIRDTGSGIPEDVQPRIFDPFFTTKERGRGTGLGLATVYGVLRQCGGYVDVESRSGEGSTFHAYFPAVEARSADVPHGGAGPARGGAERVLVVEDEPEVRRLVRTVLERAGYRVADAGNIREAEQTLASTDADFDLLITDIVMPGGTGAELYERLTQVRPAMRVVFMSGYADDEAVAEAVMQPGTVFLQKPFTIEALVRRVREALDR